jgi:hypothetical protein
MGKVELIERREEKKNIFARKASTVKYKILSKKRLKRMTI